MMQRKETHLVETPPAALRCLIASAEAINAIALSVSPFKQTSEEAQPMRMRLTQELHWGSKLAFWQSGG